jgi:hypothetical protein
MAFNITRGVIPTAKKVVIYGPEGIGKSTFASRFPDPVFIDTEGSTKALNVVRVDVHGWKDIKDAATEIILGRAGVPCKTLVLDTADWAEAMCADYVCTQNRWNSLSSPGYGTGYRVNWETFKELIEIFNGAIANNINVVITAHAFMRKFEQPDEAGAYDRWEMKLQNSPKANIAATVKEWADMVLFANYRVIVSDKDKQGKGKAQGGRRVMYASHHPCWDAKNRYGLPDMMDFDYQAIAGIIDGAPTAPTAPVREDRAVVPMSQPKPAEKPATKPAERKAPATAAPKATPKNQEPPKTEPPKTEPKETAQEQPKAEAGAAKYMVRGEVLDERLPEPLRSAMTTYDVAEWDLWNVIQVRLPGTFPHDSKLWELPREFFAQWAIPNMPKIAAMAKKAREDEEIPFA